MRSDGPGRLTRPPGPSEARSHADAPSWHAIRADEVLARVGSSERGLPSDEAARRRSAGGPNSLPRPKPDSWGTVLLRQFASPLILILLIAGAATVVQQEWVDAAAILLVVLLNAVLGFWQERKAQRDLRGLTSLEAPTARVRRDSGTEVLAARDVVVGDVVLLEPGDRVPADIRLLSVLDLQVDESALTGESLASGKAVGALAETTALADRANMTYTGTLVMRGRGSGVVVATGRATELGRISDLVQETDHPTPLQKVTRDLERYIGIALLIAVAFVFVVGLAGGYGLAEMFRTAVALAVASIPESLPVILTVALSVGVSRLARRGAIVRTLPAVETLGSTTVIATDKTGTLTANRLGVEAVWTADGLWRPGDPLTALARRSLRAGALTNEAVRDAHGEWIGDAVDVAAAAIALDAGAVDDAEFAAAAEIAAPYEVEARLSQSVRRDADGRRFLFVKGAFDLVAGASRAVAGSDEPVGRDGPIWRAHEALAGKGLRVIATAERALRPDEVVSYPMPAPRGLTLLGLEAMTDPPRAGVEEAIAACHRAGIAVKMLTGDHTATACAVAARLGIDVGRPPVTSTEMASLDDAILAARLEETGIAARVTPLDKLRIVHVLEERGEVVAVTGDGVNDAPALKAASIGVAMGRSGTDVARDAADIVLTDDNFATIVSAVEQGRVTFAAIRNATFFLLSTAVAGVLALSMNVLLGQPLLFLPVQILWINVVTDSVQDIALAFEPAQGDELSRRPRPRSEGVLSRALWFRTFITGVWMAIVVLLMFEWSLRGGADLETARTLALVTFVLFNVFQVGNARSERLSLIALSPLRNRLLLTTVVASILLLWVAVSWAPAAELLGLAPLAFSQWLLAGCLASTVLVIVEVDKLVRRLAARRHRSPATGPSA
ncbi:MULTISPECIES: HAD-IC family P-type ATPase [Microbacterium]|uniref:cation-translocating P-type ATPase n=1 Tax=Microbacterium TaxID=33882 RepID=UPI00146ADBB5|nr:MULTISPECIES: HAD-IC family P-type ATPase [Microbacterium]